MADHYSLDIDPDGLKTVKEWVGALSNHLHTKGAAVAGTPAEIGEKWTGAAAVSIMGEMTGLGDIMKSPLATDLDAIAGAIGTLEGHYRTALEEDLPDLNQRWRDADQTYQDAVDEADSAYDRDTRTEPGEPPMNQAIRNEFQTIRSTAVSSASTARETTRGDIDDDYDELKEFLRQKTRQLNTAMVEHTPVEVPASALEAYQENGSYPKYPLTSPELLEQLGVTQQYLTAQEEAVKAQAEEDVEHLRELLDDRDPYDSVELRELLASYAELADDPLYAKYFALAGGSELVQDVYDAANNDLAVDSSLTDEDWESALRGFNDLMAAGLAEVSDYDLGEFSRGFQNPEYAPILGAMTGSEHADDRLSALSLALSYYMDPGYYYTPKYSHDIGRYMQSVMNDGKSYDEMVQGFIDASDPELVARMVNNFGPETRDIWLNELLNGHSYDSMNGARDADVSEYVATDLIPSLLTKSRDGEYEETLEGLLKAVDDYNQSSSIESNEWPIDLATFLKDPKTIDLLAKKDTQVDGAVVAEVFDEYLDEEDVSEMIEALITRNADGGAGMEVTARNVGYLLGLADAADFDFNEGAVLKPAIDAARGHIVEKLTTAVGKSVPLLNTAISVLEALSGEYERRDQQRQNFGDEWADEQLHENLAWIIYLENNGAPESYTEWQNDPAAQQSVSEGDPLAAASEYLDWLEAHGADSDEYEQAQEIRGLQTIVGDAHR